jgi:acetoin utilization deacetylase AcuC-like enzyme
LRHRTIRRIGFVDHPVFRQHHTGIGHPESHERLIAIEKHLNDTGLKNRLIPVDAPEIDLEKLYPVHQNSYVTEMLNFCRAGDGYIPSMETEVGPATAEAALRAAGGCVHAAEMVLNGELDAAFAAVRPPGHHATNHIAMGFCMFNNIAITAHYLLSKGLSRILILDWDLHHGNGTQAAFYSDPRVLFVSLHQRGLYPAGSGFPTERGTGDGEGYNWNIPLMPGTGHDEILSIFRDQITPRVLEFQPEFILISAGFDGHRDDLLGNLAWEERTYSEATRMVRGWADRSANGRIVSILEGGYSLTALPLCVEAHLEALLQ